MKQVHIPRKKDSSSDTGDYRKEPALRRSGIHQPPSEDEQSVYKPLQESLPYDTRRKRPRIQQEKGGPGHSLCHRSIRRGEDSKRLSKRSCLDHREPPIGLAMTGKGNSKKEPKRKAKNGNNEIHYRLGIRFRIGQSDFLNLQGLGNSNTHRRVISVGTIGFRALRTPDGKKPTIQLDRGLERLESCPSGPQRTAR